MENTFGIDLKWLSVTCFEFRIGNTTIVSDPCVTDSPGTELTWENIENCDIITLSHGHWDHITDIPALVEKYHPLILTGDCTAQPLAKWLNESPTRVYPMHPNVELDFRDVKIRGLYGRHCDTGSGFNNQVKGLSSRPWSLKHPESMEVQAWGSMEYRNFLFTLKNGSTLLLWGNDPTVEQKNMLAAIRPDIAILQLSKQDPVEMGEFAAAIGCKVALPHHMDLKMTEEQYMIKVNAMQEEFLKRNPEGTFICPRHGEWIHL